MRVVIPGADRTRRASDHYAVVYGVAGRLISADRDGSRSVGVHLDVDD